MTRESRPGRGTEAADENEDALTKRVTPSPEIPEYKSPEWWALDSADWRRQAAVTIAANRWHAIALSAYGWDLLDEAIDWHGRKTFSDWSSAVAEAVKGRRLGPSHVELERRRAVLGPNYRPHPGGPIDFWTGDVLPKQKKVSPGTAAQGSA